MYSIVMKENCKFLFSVLKDSTNCNIYNICEYLNIKIKYFLLNSVQ